MRPNEIVERRGVPGVPGVCAPLITKAVRISPTLNSFSVSRSELLQQRYGGDTDCNQRDLPPFPKITSL